MSLWVPEIPDMHEVHPEVWSASRRDDGTVRLMRRGPDEGARGDPWGDTGCEYTLSEADARRLSDELDDAATAPMPSLDPDEVIARLRELVQRRQDAGLLPVIQGVTVSGDTRRALLEHRDAIEGLVRELEDPDGKHWRGRDARVCASAAKLICDLLAALEVLR